MYKEVLRGIDNIAIWPVISFVIFFLFFLGLLWWTFSVDKKFIARMSNMPIEGDQQDVKSPESQTEKV
jgi:cytochrome c oxidase cbb3-type subunit 4